VAPPVETMLNVRILSAPVATQHPVLVFLDYNVACNVRLLQIVIKQAIQPAKYADFHVAVQLANVWIFVSIAPIVTVEGARLAQTEDATLRAMLLVA